MRTPANLRVVVGLFLVLSVPVWQPLMAGSLDPDDALLRLGVAAAAAIAVEYVVRLFTAATQPGPGQIDDDPAQPTDQPSGTPPTA